MKKLRIGKTDFNWGSQTYIMGILNITPDSFSGDGVMHATATDWVEAAVAQGVQQEADGAHILDVGGESTRPGSAAVTAEEELQRVIPVIKILSRIVKIPISIDTYRAETVKAALEAGASMINDVWGMKRDPQMAAVAAMYKVPIILMHNRSDESELAINSDLGGRYAGAQYGDIIQDIKKDLLRTVDIALSAGIPRECIILDPGIGFGKTVEQNLELVYRLRELTDIEYPLFVGPSRKSFVGYTLDLPPTERLEGTAAAVTLCIERGADIVRVHDVKEMKRVASFTDAVVRNRSTGQNAIR